MLPHSLNARKTFPRRTLLKQAAAGLAAGSLLPHFLAQRCAADGPASGFRIGSCSIGLDDAKKAGLDGAEVRVGDPADKLEIADPAVRRQYKEKMKETGLVISSLQMALLNNCPLASDARGPAWLEQSIDAAQDLGAKSILVAFFAKGNLLKGKKEVKKAELDVVVERLKAAAPRAKAAGVRLGIESYLPAPVLVNVLDRIGRDAVGVWYDVGNTTVMGYDVPGEIRLLNDRIVSFHFKDGPHYLGEGDVKFEPIAAAITEIGYRGWIVMETPSPSKDEVADARRNAAFIRRLFSPQNGA